MIIQLAVALDEAIEKNIPREEAALYITVGLKNRILAWVLNLFGVRIEVTRYGGRWQEGTFHYQSTWTAKE